MRKLSLTFFIFFTCIFASSAIILGTNLPAQLKNLSTDLSSLKANLDKLQSKLKKLTAHLENKPSHTLPLLKEQLEGFFEKEENIKKVQGCISGSGLKWAYQNKKIDDAELNTFLTIFKKDFDKKSAAHLLSFSSDSGVQSWIAGLAMLIRKPTDLQFFAKKIHAVPDNKNIFPPLLAETIDHLNELKKLAEERSMTPSKLQIPILKATPDLVNQFFKNKNKCSTMKQNLENTKAFLKIKKTSDDDLKCFLTGLHERKKTLF